MLQDQNNQREFNNDSRQTQADRSGSQEKGNSSGNKQGTQGMNERQ